MQSHMQLMFGNLSDVDKLQICVKGKSILEFCFVSKGIQKVQNIETEQKSTKKWFDRAALWLVYVYLIISTSVQKQNPVANSVRQIKNRCAKNKFAERTDNFLIHSLMQLMFGDFWDLDKLQICSKEKIYLKWIFSLEQIWSLSRSQKFRIPFRFNWHPKDPKNCNRAKSTKNGLTEPPFGEYVFFLLLLFQHQCKRKIQ